MSSNAPQWNDTENLDEFFMEAGEGDETALEKLGQALSKESPKRMSDWPKPVRECWKDGIEIAIDPVDPRNLSAAATKLVNTLAPTGYDLPKFRDCLATLARKKFSTYPDPAGMMEATGIYKTSIPTDQIARRACDLGCPVHQLRDG